MTLDQLYYFDAVCRNENNMTKAAREISVAQSCISTAIRNLEQEFKIQLFFRCNKKLVLTKEGQKFLEMAREILQKSNAIAEAFQPKCMENLPINIGLSVICFNMLSQLLRRYREEYPYSIDGAYTFETTDLVNLLRLGTITLAIVGSSHLDDWREFESKIVARNTTYFYTYSEHPLASCQRVTAEQLANEPLVYFTAGPVDVEQINDTLKYFIPGVHLNNIVSYTSQMDILRNHIREKTGSAIIGRNALSRDPDIVEIPIEGAIPFHLTAIWRKDVLLPQNAVRFLNYIEKQFNV